MLRFARPRSVNPLTWWDQTDPPRFQRLIEYCRQDVEAERQLDRHVPELSRRERILFELDFLINARGLGIDHALVMELAHLADIAREDLTARILRLTNGQVRSLGQVVQLRDWLRLYGVDMPDLRRATVEDRLTDRTLPGPAREALQARLDASRSSTAKLVSISQAASGDGRVRGAFQYYGANRTGRWAGRRVQPQNLFRGVIKDVPAALKLIRAGVGVEDLDLLFEASPLGVVASCLRSTIQAQAGHVLAIADFSQIEARVLAWLAGQMDALAIFADPGQDIYVETAAGVGSTSRQMGKVLVLACGFGMGGERFRQTAAGYGLELDIVEAYDAVAAWRRLNDRIVDLWWELHRVVLRVTRRGPGAGEATGFLEVIHKPGMLLVKLPSQRHLVYRRPLVVLGDTGHDEFSYMGAIGSTWTRLRAWPGRLVENVTQAVARDVMAEAMLGLQDLPLIATIHDELIAEVPVDDADDTLARMLARMKIPPGWAPGLPVNAAGVVSTRYHK